MRSIPRLCLVAAFTLPGLAAANTPKLLVPAYFYPAGVGAADWTGLTGAAGQAPITAIINPNSGPGSAADANYTAAISAFRAAGGKVLGYVSTNYGNRDVQAVRTDIDNYLNWYPVDGLFFDETATDAASLSFYEAATLYARSRNKTLSLVGNPGTTPAEAYLALFNTLVIHEDQANKLANYTPPAYMEKYDDEQFGMLIIDGSEAQMKEQIAYAAANNFGYVYVSDRDLGANEWGALPTYWTSEVAAIGALNNVVPEPGSLPMMAAGLALLAGVARRRTAGR